MTPPWLFELAVQTIGGRFLETIPTRDLLARGATKDEIFARTGHVVGVHNVSFDVQEGEIFVLMGLSGSGKSKSRAERLQQG